MPCVYFSEQLTTGPDVHRFAICLLPQNLRGQIPRCASKSCRKKPPKQLIDMLKAIDCVGAICGSAYIGSNIIVSKMRPIGPNKTEILTI